MARGPMATQTAESGPTTVKGDAFSTLPQKDSRVKRTGMESGDGKVQGTAK